VYSWAGFGLVPTLVVLSSTGVLATVVAWTSPLTAQLGSSTDTSSLKGDPAAPPPSRSA
jgi:hypothetical protein